MTTKLEGELKRELTIRGDPYTLTLSPAGFKLTEKGRRLGIELQWEDVISGDAALARALQASVAPAPRPTKPKPPKRKGKVVDIRSKRR
jgi:hypothetical protein